MNKEIDALLKLLDDPDEEVYNAVSKKISSYGEDIIPILENYQTQISKEKIHYRIDSLIQQLQFTVLKQSFIDWKNDENAELLFGAFLLSKYSLPHLEIEDLSNEIDRLKQNIWIELNNYLTPLEKINVINNITFRFHKYSGVEINYKKNSEFLIAKLLETKKGNSFSLVVLYVSICQLLDVPVYALKFPKQFILCYLDPHTDYFKVDENNFYKIKFFIDPVFGNIISHNDVEIFFKRINVPLTSSYFRPLTNVATIQQILIEYQKCYNKTEHFQQIEDLEELIKLLD